MKLNDLRGVIPALATPLTINEEIDERSLRKIVKRVIEAGVNGVLVLGSTGEGVMLNEKEKICAMEIVIDEVKGKIPVMVGTGDLNTKKVKENNRIAASMGAKYALVVPPFYFQLRQEDIMEYYQDIAADETIPILIYHIPQNTKISADIHIIEKLSKIENIVGIKDSSGELGFFQQLVFNCQNEKFKVFAGKANIVYTGFLIGAAGSITPIPNIDPGIEIDLYNSILNNNLDRALDIHKRILNIAELLKNDVLPVSVNLMVALEIMGLCDKFMIKPLPQASENIIKDIKNKLKELYLI